MNPFVSKTSAAELVRSGLKMFLPAEDSAKEELFVRDIQSYYRMAESLMSKVHEIESEDRKLILVVDDEQLTCELVEEFLIQAEIKCDMITAANGVKAFDLACSLTPDLIITDWLMPEMDGPELIGKLRDDPRTSQIPIILMTGLLPSSDYLGEVLDAGTADYLRKPIDYMELKTRVKAALALNESIKEVQRLNDSICQQDLLIRFMLGIVPDPTFFIDGRGYFGGCNNSFENFTKKTSAELEGRLASKALPTALGNLVSSLLESGTSEEMATFEYSLPEMSRGDQSGPYVVTFRIIGNAQERLVIGQVTGRVNSKRTNDRVGS